MNSIKQGARLPYTMGFLMKRYQIRQQSLNEYIKKHIDEINKDGIHARKVGKEWRFDGVAIRVIDELRDFAGDSVVIAGYETAEELKIRELEQALVEANEEIRELKADVDSRETIIKMQNNLIESNKEQLFLLTTQSETEKAEKDERIKVLEEEQIADREKMTLLTERAMLAEAELAKERSKGFWEKVKDLFG